MTESPPTTIQFCAYHPNRETSLRCNRCNKPICSDCAIHTPTGYRCKECVRSQQKKFDTAEWYDYIVAAATALVISFAGSWLASLIGFFTILLAPGVGVLIAEAVRFLVRRRRSRQLFIVTVVAAVIGALPFALLSLLGAFGGGFNLFGLIWQGLYLFVVPSTAYTRLSGLQLRR